MLINILFKMWMLALAVLLAGPLTASAATQQTPMQQLQAVLADPERTREAYAQGEERVAFCSYCHGKDGNSVRTNIPNLAEQRPEYLFATFEKFATGERTDYVMNRLAKTLSLEERINIALYYGKQKVQPKAADRPDLVEQGKIKFQQCVACHESSGLGAHDKPRLAGQPADYIRYSLKLFRSVDPARPLSEMTAIAANLSDEDIEELAEYLQSLSP